MSIKHAPWGTPPVPVTTGNWTQDNWDRFYEAYRPAGYDAGRYDQTAHDAWKAKKLVEAAVEYFHEKKITPLATLADITSYVQVARQCRCENCVCCAVLEEVLKRREKYGSSWWREEAPTS